MLQMQELRCVSEFVSEFAVGKLLAAQKTDWRQLVVAGWFSFFGCAMT